MDEEIRKALANEILSEFEDLKNLEAGSKEQQMAVENVTKLYRLGLEESKSDTDWDEICNRRTVETKREQNELDKQEREEQFKKDQLEEQKKDRYFRLGVEAAGIILPMMFYAVWMKRGFKFEETGTYTSTTFRGLFNRFRPTRK